MPRPLPDAAFDQTPYGGDGWTLTASRGALALPRTPAVFTIGNGFIGVRGPGDVPGAPTVFLNGVFAVTPITYHEAAHGFARSSDTRFGVADAVSIMVEADGTPLPTVTVELDFRAGLRRERRSAPGGDVLIETLVSMTRPGVVATRIVVARGTAPVGIRRHVGTPPSAGGEVRDLDDPRVSAVTAAGVWAEAQQIDLPGVQGRVDRLAGSGFAVAAVVQPLDVTVAAPDEAVVDGFAAYAAERGVDPLPLAVSALEAAAAANFDGLAAEQRAWFDRFWADAMIAAPRQPHAEQALRHGLLQLVMAAGRDARTSLAAKGQSGEGYEGHVFWDAETYALPVLTHVAPEIARAMLSWRIAGLDAARANARAMGHPRGALYPWRTIAGGECSAYFPAGSAQYHINADVALALGQYLDATGDTSILAGGGAVMLAETARIWLQIGFHDVSRGGAFVINRVTGPDEYSALVNNNLYTNLMAAEHLRLAARLGEVDADETGRMTRAADAMFLPYDRAHDVPAQDDAFFALDPWPLEATPADDYPLLLHYHPLTLYRHRVAKQADAILAAALLPERFDRDTRRRMLDVYEAVTVHDSTLSASAFAIVAAQAGDGARAVHYWRVSMLTDLHDLFGNTSHGLHMAALAGGWNVLAFGFGGLRTRGGTLRIAPVFYPDVGPYAFCLRFRGRALEVTVDERGGRCELREGAPVELTVHDRTVTLAAGQPSCWRHP